MPGDWEYTRRQVGFSVTRTNRSSATDIGKGTQAAPAHGNSVSYRKLRDAAKLRAELEPKHERYLR